MPKSTHPRSIKGRAIVLYTLLLLSNLGAWAWALLIFRGHPLLLGTAALAYTFGIRHAFDVDHIAAIDNVTRKLIQTGQRPVGVGFFFSLGHSTVVIALSIAIALSAVTLQTSFSAFKDVGALVGTLVSSFFLFAIALANVVVLMSLVEAFRHLRHGASFEDLDVDLTPSKAGLLGRLFHRAFRVVGSSWHMYPIGFLFGLGFDTATEVGLLGISATEASHGLPIWSILVFPALFTAGMTLFDSTDSLLMLGAYEWALIKPVRKVYYNLTMTAASALVAIAVGSIEMLGLIGDRFGVGDSNAFWRGIGALNDSSEILGASVVAIFVGAWLVSALIYRVKDYDRAAPALP